MKPPSLILWQRKIGESSNINPDGRRDNMALSRKTIRARPMKTPALQANNYWANLIIFQQTFNLVENESTKETWEKECNTSYDWLELLHL